MPFKDEVYRVWAGIIQRCHNKKSANYSSYGKRGISVWIKWRESFKAFADYIGSRPSKEHQLSRIDNNGNYEPGNVRWATRKEQARNKRTTIHVTYRGVNKSLMEWADLLGFENVQSVRYRLRLGWTAEEAFDTPVWILRVEEDSEGFDRIKRVQVVQSKSKIDVDAMFPL